MWTILPSSSVRPTHDPRPGSIERFCKYSLFSGVAWYAAAKLYIVPLGRQMFAFCASHKRAADSTSVSITACRSNAERLMTLSTSAVAVCCCSDCRSSSNSRTLSIAMAAWSAKVSTRATSSAISAGTNRISAYKIVELLRSVDGYHHPQQLAIETVNVRSVSPAQPDRAFGDGFKHGLKIERRAADNLK